jgi:hypothetical protein
LVRCKTAGRLSLSEEQLADAVFKALGFDRLDEATLVEYLRTPKLMGLARQDAQRTTALHHRLPLAAGSASRLAVQ